MKKLVCDVCGRELSLEDNYNENGYSQFVNVEIRDSRTYGDEYDICNDCYDRILGFAQGMKENKE